MPSAAPETLLTVEEWLANWIAAKTMGDLAGKVFPLFVPESDDLPAATYRRMRTARESSSRGANGLAKPWFEVAVLATSDSMGYATITKVATTIRLALDGFQADTQRGQHVRQVTLEDESDDDTPPVFANGVVTFRRVLTLSVAHLEQTRSIIGGS